MFSNLKWGYIQTALAVCITVSLPLQASKNVISNTSVLPMSPYEIMISKSFKYKEYVALKDIDAYTISLRTRISKSYGLYVDYESSDISFKGFNLHNQKMKLINKISLYRKKKFHITTDLIFERNQADDIAITDNWTLNKILKEIAPDKNIKIVDDEIIFGSSTVNIYDKNGNFIQPKVNISNLYSNSFGLKTYFGYGITYDSYLDVYLSIVKNNIYGDVSFEPQSDMIKSDGSLNSISRDELVLASGFTYFKRFDDLKLEFNYEYNKFYRDIVNKYNVNQTADLVFNYSLTERLNLFFQVKYMTHQLMNYIPYSYNKLTAYSFSRHYGFFKTGLIYEF